MHRTQLRRRFTLGAIATVAVAASAAALTARPARDEIAYSELLVRANRHELSAVSLQGNVVEVVTMGGDRQVCRVPDAARAAEQLATTGVHVSVAPPGFAPLAYSTASMVLPMLGMGLIWLTLLRRGGGLSRTSTSAPLKIQPSPSDVRFANVAGVDEAKHELAEIVEFLRDPAKFQRLGCRIPKGVLLAGPPGTGKTLLARAVAGEANVPFFSISGSSFVEMFVGVGAKRVRELFAKAKQSAPCIVFIDEIDAVGRHRGAGVGGGNDEREQTLNQLLVEMDGFAACEGIIIVAATNRPDVLDPALLRPGRFDRQVAVLPPDLRGREAILQVHLAKVPLGTDVDITALARSTPGFAGADLENLVNEAALLAARAARSTVSLVEFEAAKDKVMMGPERRSLVMTEEERRLTAYHEAGHAVVACYSPASDPVHKATITPRGSALGAVMRLPDADRRSMTKAKLLADLAVAMGGRVAEALVFGADKITTGAQADIRAATTIARQMVADWGMSERLGPVAYSVEQDSFLGQALLHSRSVAEQTAREVDREIRALATAAEAEAKAILIEHNAELHALAEALLLHETLSGEQINEILAKAKRKTLYRTAARALVDQRQAQAKRQKVA